MVESKSQLISNKEIYLKIYDCDQKIKKRKLILLKKKKKSKHALDNF